MKLFIRFTACLVLALSAVAAPARADALRAGDLVITKPWSRATPSGAKVAGGYLTIENTGSVSDRLVQGSGDIAGTVEVHEMAMNNGVMTMRPLDNGLTIEPGKTVTLAPGGTHLMLMNIKSPLRQGDKVPLTLEFEKAGRVTVSLDVQGVGAPAPASADGSGGHEDKQMAVSSFAIAADDNFFTHLHTEKAMANVTVSPGRAGPVDIAIQLERPDETPLTVKAVSVTLSDNQPGSALQTLQATLASDNQWRVHASLPAPGRWMLGLGISISETDTVSVESPILIK